MVEAFQLFQGPTGPTGRPVCTQDCACVGLFRATTPTDQERRADNYDQQQKTVSSMDQGPVPGVLGQGQRGWEVEGGEGRLLMVTHLRATED